MDSSQTLPDLRALLAELAEEARQFRFEVAPNPCVGAAVIASGRVVARGYHEVWGEAHAEVNALAAAAASGVPASEWDTLVVTLEPCSTKGKTPACTQAVLASGLRRVVVGGLDPDPRHRGEGLRVLQEAGVEVELMAEAVAIDRHFEHWLERERMRRPRPWVIAKWAQTRSGQLLPPEDIGEGRWISSPDSLAEVQVLRGRVDAIVTGIGTVLADDPRFTVRPPGDLADPPLRVVLDTHMRTRPDGRLFGKLGEQEAGGPVHVLYGAGASASARERRRMLTAAGAVVTPITTNERGSLSLRAVETWLWDQGVHRVLLEAGPTLLQRALELGFVDQLRVYTGDVLGGRGPSMGEWLARLGDGDQLFREIGSDSVLDAFLGLRA